MKPTHNTKTISPWWGHRCLRCRLNSGHILLPPLCKHMAGDTTCKSTQGIGRLLSIDRQELFGIILRVQICMSTQHTNNDKTFPLWATLPRKHMPTKTTVRTNTFFFCCVAPRGISFAGRSPTPPLRSPIAALRGWPARTREYAGLGPWFSKLSFDFLPNSLASPM